MHFREFEGQVPSTIFKIPGHNQAWVKNFIDVPEIVTDKSIIFLKYQNIKNL